MYIKEEDAFKERLDELTIQPRLVSYVAIGFETEKAAFRFLGEGWGKGAKLFYKNPVRC